MKKLLIVAAFGLGSLSMSAHAEMYAEVGYGGTLYDLDGSKASAGIMRGVFGYSFNDNLAIEGIHGFGVRDGKIEEGGTVYDEKIKTRQVFGLYLTPKMKFTDNLEGFARIGGSRVDATLKTVLGDARASESGFSYGLGIRYNINKVLTFNTDYMSYYKDGVEKVHGLTLGLGFRF